jgi:hypothetical protein
VLDNAERRLQVDHTLVDLHLESIPSLGTYKKYGQGRRLIEHVPSPLGAFLVVILRDLVGIRTGPLTWRSLSLAPVIRSLETKGWHVMD